MPERLEFDVEEKEVVRKANELVRARHDFSVIEQRLFAAMVAQLDRSEEEFGTQRVRIQDICDDAGKDTSHVYRQIDSATQRLMEKVIVIRDRDSGGKEQGFEKYSLFSSCKYQKGGGVVEAQFNDNMREFLLQLKERYTLYLYEIFLRLESKYSTQLYEMIKMRQGLHRLSLPVEEFRQQLGLEDKYSRFVDLKRRVIEQAREELKEKADVYFTYQVHRTNNRPQEIEFFIHENDDIIDQLKAKNMQSSKVGKTQTGGTDQDSKEPEMAQAKRLFWMERDQEEVNCLTQGRVDRLYEKARERADTSGPESHQQSMIFQRMEEMWGGRN